MTLPATKSGSVPRLASHGQRRGALRTAAPSSVARNAVSARTRSARSLRTRPASAPALIAQTEAPLERVFLTNDDGRSSDRRDQRERREEERRTKPWRRKSRRAIERLRLRPVRERQKTDRRARTVGYLEGSADAPVCPRVSERAAARARATRERPPTRARTHSLLQSRRLHPTALFEESSHLRIRDRGRLLDVLGPVLFVA